MHKIIFLMLLVAAGNSAAAEWVQTVEDVDFVGYVDVATIRKTGDIVRMSILTELKMPKIDNGKSYWSSVSEHEYDCKKEQARILSIAAYTSIMGEGEAALTDSTPEQWGQVLPGTKLAAYWKFACTTR